MEHRRHPEEQTPVRLRWLKASNGLETVDTKMHSILPIGDRWLIFKNYFPEVQIFNGVLRIRYEFLQLRAGPLKSRKIMERNI